MYTSVGSYRDALSSSSIHTIQHDIDIWHSTACSWGLSINVRKSVVLRFPRPQPDQTTYPVYTLDGLVLSTADTATDLGVTVDTELKFHSHVQSIAHKASGLSHSLLKATVRRSKEFMIFLLVTHIRPVLEYSSCLWYTTRYVNNMRLLEKVQRRWTKQIEGLSDLSYADRLKWIAQPHGLLAATHGLLSPHQFGFRAGRDQ